jgi:hypothetical protein
MQDMAGWERDGCQGTPILAPRLDKTACLCSHTDALPHARTVGNLGPVGPGPVTTGRVAQGTPWRRGAKRTRARVWRFLRNQGAALAWL